MSRSRVAAARAKLHDAIDELVDALSVAGEGGAEDAAAENPSRTRRAKARPVTDIEKARARKALRRVGMDV